MPARGGPTSSATNARVNILKVAEAMSADPEQRDNTALTRNGTVWHSLYDQEARTVEVSFYLGEDSLPDGTRRERRSDYLALQLDA